jgi:hypothetical protein
MIATVCKILRSIADTLEIMFEVQTFQVDSINPMERCAALSTPQVNERNIDKALEDEDERVRLAAIRHPKATVAHFQKGLLDASPVVQQAAGERLTQAYGG